MNIYISGGITGRTREQYEAHFNSAAEALQAQGHAPTNPVTIPHNHDNSWLNFMRNDIKAMMDCEAIYMLKGWELSRGAKIEHDLARSIGMEVIFEQ